MLETFAVLKVPGGKFVDDMDIDRCSPGRLDSAGKFGCEIGRVGLLVAYIYDVIKCL
jgi:hypothetical protein